MLSIFAFALLVLVGVTAASGTELPFSPEDVLRGVKGDREACGADAGRLWVEVDGEGDCLRFYGTPSSTDAADRPLIFFEGDVVQRAHRPGAEWVVWDRYARMTPALMQAEAEQVAASLGRPFVNLARPGSFGSSGEHLKRRREREVATIDRALDGLKQRFGWSRLDLAGLSGGGHLVGALMARRSDIGCAVVASGNVAVRQRARERGLDTDVTGYADFVDPIDGVRAIAQHPPERVIVLTDPQDQVVSASSQQAFVDALRKEGVAVEHRFVAAFDRGHHILRAPAWLAAGGCGTGRSDRP